jgi:hypothetical protein
MATRTVRLDDEAERVLAELRRLTGLSVSGVLKRGLAAAREEERRRHVVPFDVYRRIDLGPGGYARAPARRAKEAVRTLVARKHSK